MIARFSHDNGVSFGEEVVLRDDYGTTERMPDLGYPRARHRLAFEFARFVCARPCCRQGLRRRTTARSSACTTGRPRSCSGSTSRRRRSARPAARRCSCCAQSSSVLRYGFVSLPALSCLRKPPTAALPQPRYPYRKMPSRASVRAGPAGVPRARGPIPVLFPAFDPPPALAATAPPMSCPH